MLSLAVVRSTLSAIGCLRCYAIEQVGERVAPPNNFVNGHRVNLHADQPPAASCGGWRDPVNDELLDLAVDGQREPLTDNWPFHGLSHAPAPLVRRPGQ